MPRRYGLPLCLIALLAAAGCAGENGSPVGVREVSSSPPAAPGGPLDAALVEPADGSVNVPLGTALRLTFTHVPEDAVPALLTGPAGAVPLAPVPGGGEAVTLVPDAPLRAGTAYTVTVPVGTRGWDGAVLATTRVWHFTTASLPGQPVVLPAAPWGGPGAWAPVVRVDPVAGPAEVTLGPDGAPPTDEWTLVHATTLYAHPGALAPHVLHGFRLVATPLAGGPGADVALTLAVGWTDVTPAGLPGPLRDVVALSRSLAWAAGDGGALRVSRDGGRTWDVADSGTMADLFALRFVTPWNGWAVGAGGTLLHTADGATWGPLPKVTGADIYDVTFVGTDLGLAVGDGGTVLRTTDRGGSWAMVDTPVKARLRRVACAGATDCHAVGDGGTILASTDGGATWGLQATNTGADLYGYAEGGDGYRWAVGEGGIVVVGGGGSAGWVVRGATGQQWLADIAFADRSHAWAVGTGGSALVSVDGGSVWAVQPLPGPAHLAAVAAADTGRLVAVGADGAGAPLILLTDTGGEP
jgi:photosystem II stability/assembly factor-like uncharacterized protein